MAVGSWGIQPASFWDHMGPREFWWLFDVKRTDRRQIDLRNDTELLDMLGKPAKPRKPKK